SARIAPVVWLNACLRDARAARCASRQGTGAMTLVVILTVRSQLVEQFRAFERRAAAVMATHGGAIERTVVIPPRDANGLLQEVHIGRFPDARAFEAYRQDSRLADVAHFREASVVRTEVLIGEDGPVYMSPAE